MGISNAKQALIWMWIIAALLIIFCLIFWGQSYAGESNNYNDLTGKEREIAGAMEEKYLNSENKRLRFNGDTVIEKDEYIHGDIIVVKGTLEIRGEIEGTALALFGDIELEPTSIVNGNVISVDGVVWTKDGAEVKGDIIEVGNTYRKRYKEYHQDSEEKRIRAEENIIKEEKEEQIRRDYYRNRTDQEPMYVNYNRVDGITLGLQFPSAGWWERHNHNFAILGKGGYSFSSKKTQFSLGLEKWLLEDRRFTIGGEYHDMTDSEDNWIIDDTENSLAAFFFKQDFKDYYNREGFTAYVCDYLTHSLKIKAEYRNDQFTNLEKKTDWSIFGGDNKKFRSNPYALPLGLTESTDFSPLNNQTPILELRSVGGTITFDTRDRISNPGRGWYVEAFGERVGFDEESDMDFERYIIDIRRYQPLGWDENLNFRLRGGTAKGDMPPMYWFDLGGISTLRGYRFKEFTGDRMVLGNIEYRLKTSSNDWFILDDFDIILFVDSGYAWFADKETPDRVNEWKKDDNQDEEMTRTDPKDSFENLTWNSLKTNIGFAIASHNDDFRINFAKRTDLSGQDLIVTFRIQRTF
ncbi:BamA/TamA family outer membrane protein [candidate division KSB1 bacterium]|nr:BamA/TamA family outer membrane protein [candidate division KSB1 bacterium]